MKTDLLDLLYEQHAEIDGLLARLADPTIARRDTFLELATTLAAHIAVETRVFFPAIMREHSELRRRSVDECQAIKRQVADMLGLDPDSADRQDIDTFDLRLRHLATAIRHHSHDFEEVQLFPLLAELMDDREREDLGGEAVILYASLMSRDEAPQRLAA